MAKWQPLNCDWNDPRQYLIRYSGFFVLCAKFCGFEVEIHIVQKSYSLMFDLGLRKSRHKPGDLDSNLKLLRRNKRSEIYGISFPFYA